MSVVRKLEHLFVAGGYLQVRREAEKLMLEGSLSTHEQAAVERLACRACLGMSEYYGAVKWGERAVASAQKAGEVNLRGKALFDLGTAYLFVGDTVGAEQTLCDFFRLLPLTRGLGNWEGQAHFNLALIYQQQKRWGTAAEALTRAASLLKQHNRTREWVLCTLHLAWSHLMIGASAAAAPHLARVEEFLGHTPDEEISLDLLSHRALYYRLEEDIATSSHLCQEIFMPGRRGVTSHHMGQAAWIMGENALDLGRIEEAVLFANMALDHAARCNWPTLMNLGSDLRRRIASRMTIGA